MIANVLGTEYKIKVSNRVEEPELNECKAFCDVYSKEIVIDDGEVDKKNVSAVRDMDSFKRESIRHELLHAFLYESGLYQNTWAGNEEIVDFFAIQFPKIAKLFSECCVVA